MKKWLIFGVVAFDLTGAAFCQTWVGLEPKSLTNKIAEIYGEDIYFSNIDVVYSDRIIGYLLVVDSTKTQGFVVEFACQDSPVATAVSAIVFTPPIYRLSDSSGGIATQGRPASALRLLEHSELVQIDESRRIQFPCGSSGW